MPRHDDDFEDDEGPRRPRRRPRDDDFDDLPPPRKKSGNGLLIGILVGVFVICCGGGGTAAFFIFRSAKRGVEQVQTAMGQVAETAQSRNNLMQIGIAFHNHTDATRHMPNNSYEVRNGQVRPLLSWRVHLLPYLEQEALYRQFKLDEPWDSPNNIRLLNQMPAVYATPEARKLAGGGKTFYRGFHSPGGVFEPATPNNPNPRVTFAGVPDGLMNTILVIDAGAAVEWTKPDDLDFTPGKPRPALGGAYPTLPFTLVLMGDGSVRQMPKDIADETLRNLINRNDGRVLPPNWDR